MAIGISFAPTFWGFMAGATELTAGVLFLVGFAIRPAAAAMVFVMLVAGSHSLDRKFGLDRSLI